jgi:hypothetical protein
MKPEAPQFNTVYDWKIEMGDYVTINVPNVKRKWWQF